MVQQAQVWKKKYPKSKGIAKELLMRSKMLFFPIIGRLNIKPANPQPWPLDIETELKLASRFPFVPEFEFLRSGIQAERDFGGTFVWENYSGPLPSYLFDYFEVTLVPGMTGFTQWHSGQIHVTVKSRSRGSVSAGLRFTTLIDVHEEGLHALQVKSIANLFAGSALPHGEFRPNYYTLTHDHLIDVIWQKPGNPDVKLTRNPWYENTYYQRYADPSHYEDAPYLDRLGYVAVPGPNAETHSGYDDEILLNGIEEGIATDGTPYYVQGAGGKTTLEEGYPMIDLFMGPCTIKIIESIRYWHLIKSSSDGNTMEGLNGFLGPLNWSLFKVKWIPRDMMHSFPRWRIP